MRKCTESDIEFDFSQAQRVFEHDTATSKCDGGSSPDGNTGWPGVDFRVEDDAGWIWLEVKNWRGRMRGSFSARMNNKEYAREMRSKFLGTSAHLAWNNSFTSGPVRYILLFEPPRAFDLALFAPFQDLVRKEINTPGNMGIRTYVMCLNGDERIHGWNDLFVHLPARRRS